MTQAKEITILAVAGGLGFWVANFAISLTPIAAEYRAALSISYYPMLFEALIGGLVILKLAHPAVLILGGIDTVGAFWTWIELRKRKQE